jgi:uncharacterized protein (DUF305 family)
MVTKRHGVTLDDHGIADKTSQVRQNEPNGMWSTWRLAVLCAAFTFLGACLLYGWQNSSSKRPDDVSVGFVNDMLDHHDQAVSMSIRMLGNVEDATVRQIAADIVQEQRYEIGMMEAWLTEWQTERSDPDRMAMTWMGMSMPVDQMPGMQPADDVQAIATLPTDEAEVSFLRMMIDHHRAGVSMADFAAGNADTERVRSFAQRVMTVQNTEINELLAELSRRGLS